MEKEQKWVIGIVVALVAFAGIFFSLSKTATIQGGLQGDGPAAPATADAIAQRQAFGQYLKQNGVTFYGAFWCPHCKEEKAMLGEEAYSPVYVECSTPDGSAETQVCKDNKIDSFPTWVKKDGTRKSGEMTPDELAQWVGYTKPTGGVQVEKAKPGQPLTEPLPTAADAPQK